MEAELTLRDYIAILRRRYMYLVIPFVLVLGASVFLAVILPPVYRSTGIILVESQQIPDELVRSTVTSLAAERIQVIQQRVMTRDNLLRIVDKFKLFKDNGARPSNTKMVEMMRKRIAIEIISGNFTRRVRRSDTTIAFQLSFEHEQADVANRVANELVTLFLEENVRTRTTRAAETTQFLSQEAGKLRNQLEASEDLVAAYKQEHSDALPEHLNLRLGSHERAKDALAETGREIKALQEERRFLDIELSAIENGIGMRDDMRSQNPAQELARLKTRLIERSAVYGATHPEIRSLKRRIAALEEELAVPPQGALEGEGQTEVEKPIMLDPAVARVQAKIAGNEARIVSLLAQRTELQQTVANLEEKIIQTPQVERGLLALTRDYDNALKKYDEMQAKQMEAQISETLEREKKAERFLLLEAPVMPEEPIRPNRPKMIAFGFFLAVAAGVGTLFVIESLDASVRGLKSLTAIIGQPPLAVIPYIQTAHEVHVRKRRLIQLAGTSGVLIIITISAVHIFYMPLDILIIKILARFG
jgi:polysaccharide chain length determinant protein (PEP-CTERM system associated)